MSEDEDREEEKPEPTEGAKVVRADELLGEEREVWIEYRGVRYLLRVTRRGRLILTK